MASRLRVDLLWCQALLASVRDGVDVIYIVGVNLIRTMGADPIVPKIPLNSARLNAQLITTKHTKNGGWRGGGEGDLYLF